MEIEIKDWRGKHTLTLPLIYKEYDGIFDSKGMCVMKLNMTHGKEDWKVSPREIIKELQERVLCKNGLI